jgi:hypothetical protein
VFTTGDRTGPIYYQANTYIQQADKLTETGAYTWKLTNNAGASWLPIASDVYRRYGFTTSICRQEGTTDRYTLYVPILDNTTVRLTKITNPATPATSQLTNPVFAELSGGIGALDLGNFRNAIFCANPFNAQQMMACESSTGKLKKSTDGGTRWNDVSSFNSFYGATNLPLLKSSQGYNSISYISYSPFSDGVIIATTLSQGIFLTRDGGQTWVKLNNPGIMMCVGVHWISANKLVVATYGRGLFVVNI